jgi:hypothetical protein
MSCVCVLGWVAPGSLCRVGALVVLRGLIDGWGSAAVPQVCKYFLDAVEKEVYGWFWVCPNGGDACKYRHALPTGYVYKSKAQRDLEAAEAADREVSSTIEEDIEKLVRGGGRTLRRLGARRLLW